MVAVHAGKRGSMEGSSRAMLATARPSCYMLRDWLSKSLRLTASNAAEDVINVRT